MQKVSGDGGKMAQDTKEPEGESQNLIAVERVRGFREYRHGR